MGQRTVGSFVLVGLVAVAGFAAGRATLPAGNAALAGPAPSGQPEDMMGMPAGMTVGPEHKALDCMIGTWTGGVKFKMGPGDEWMESKGTVTREWAMDGRFVIEHVTSSMGDIPDGFKGMGIVGYNSMEKTYESVWIENMATYMSHATGSFDAAKKIFTFEGLAVDPMTGEKHKQKTVVDCSNPTREVMTGWMVGSDGKMEKNFEGSFEKAH